MTHLLDTNVLIHHLRKIRMIDAPETAQLGISIISYAELLYGIAKKPDSDKHQQALHAVLQKLGITIINLNEQIIQRFAYLKADLEKKGQRLEDFDLFIASTALEYNLTLLTANKKHFSRIPPLKLAI